MDGPWPRMAGSHSFSWDSCRGVPTSTPAFSCSLPPVITDHGSSQHWSPQLARLYPDLLVDLTGKKSWDQCSGRSPTAEIALGKHGQREIDNFIEMCALLLSAAVSVSAAPVHLLIQPVPRASSGKRTGDHGTSVS